MSYGLRGYYGLGGVYGLGCNPGETRDLSGGGQEICGSDGSTWSPYSAPAPVAPPPPVVYNAPAAPDYQSCDPRDVACVMANQALGVNYQQSIGVEQADTDYERCIANGTDSATCRARWPVGYSGEVPFNNLTPAQQAAQLQTPAQAAATYTAAYVAQDAQLRADLNKAGQTPAAITAALGPPPTVGGTVTKQGTAPGSPALTPTLSLPGGGSFSLSSIPWWGWAGAAALALFALKGGH